MTVIAVLRDHDETEITELVIEGDIVPPELTHDGVNYVATGIAHTIGGQLTKYSYLPAT